MSFLGKPVVRAAVWCFISCKKLFKPCLNNCMPAIFTFIKFKGHIVAVGKMHNMHLDRGMVLNK
jgi:hypothetical protein